jgi:hypothetical protein
MDLVEISKSYEDITKGKFTWAGLKTPPTIIRGRPILTPEQKLAGGAAGGAAALGGLVAGGIAAKRAIARASEKKAAKYLVRSPENKAKGAAIIGGAGLLGYGLGHSQGRKH